MTNSGQIPVPYKPPSSSFGRSYRTPQCCSLLLIFDGDSLVPTTLLFFDFFSPPAFCRLHPLRVPKTFSGIPAAFMEALSRSGRPFLFFFFPLFRFVPSQGRSNPPRSLRVVRRLTASSSHLSRPLRDNFLPFDKFRPTQSFTLAFPITTLHENWPSFAHSLRQPHFPFFSPLFLWVSSRNRVDRENLSSPFFYLRDFSSAN